ncbi:hypothetical protein ACRRTK_010623 [Alexandromys fortis]
MRPPGTAAYGRQDARVPEPQKGGSRLVTRRVERAEPESRSWGLGARPWAEPGGTVVPSGGSRSVIEVPGFCATWLYSGARGAAPRPRDPGRAVAVTSVAGLSYLSNCVSGARPRAGVRTGGWGAHGRGRRPILGTGPRS